MKKLITDIKKLKLHRDTNPFVIEAFKYLIGKNVMVQVEYGLPTGKSLGKECSFLGYLDVSVSNTLIIKDKFTDGRGKGLFPRHIVKMFTPENGQIAFQHQNYRP